MRDGLGKIICIGLPRTGTTSFRVACEMIGLRVMGDPLGGDLVKSLSEDGRLPDNRYDSNDVFADVLISTYWVELLRAYPKATYVLTARRPFDWYESMRKRFSKPQPDLTRFDFPTNRAAGYAAYMTTGWSGTPKIAVEHELEVAAQFVGRVQPCRIQLEAVNDLDMTGTMCTITGAFRTHATPNLNPWPNVNGRSDV